MNYIYSSTIFAFAKEGNFDRAFLEVGPSSDWGVLTPNENEWICIVCDCIINFYEFTFSALGLRPPFTVFEIKVPKHLVMTPSQIHSTS